MHEPTYVTDNFTSCIDLVITDQPNLFLECNIHPSLHSNCHHQINFVKVNVQCPPPPPYSRRIWHYDRADLDSITKAIQNYDWDVSLDACPTIDTQVDIFNDVVTNVMMNFTPFDDIIVTPKDPPWLTSNIKSFYNKYKKRYRRYIKNGRSQLDKMQLNNMKDEYTKLVEKAKESYLKSLGSKLANPLTGMKAYWSALKKLLGGNKAPTIPPININNTFITSVNEKCSIFNKFFARQCTLMDTNSSLPCQEVLTNAVLNEVKFTDIDLSEKIAALIRGLNVNKAHGHDGITIRMLKICGQSISKPLTKILKNCLITGYFPTSWKKANVIPVHKKDSKQDVKNYRPISLLPICGKILEKVIFDDLYNHIFSNNLITERQSGFRKNDSTIKQLISITHDIHTAFDYNPPKNVRAVFLDISKAFDKVWHSGLLYKLKRNGVNGKILSIIESFLSNRMQRVTINGSNSDWTAVGSGVPQGSVLGPLLFLIYINDLSEVVESEIRIFADDTFIFEIVSRNVQSLSDTLHQDLCKITNWANQWKMSFNPDISKQAVEIIFSNQNAIPGISPITFNGIPVKTVVETKHLGMIIDKKLSFESHVTEKIKKANKGIGVMKQLYRYVPRTALEIIYKLYVRPHLDYGDVVYHIPDKNSATFDSENDTIHPLMARIESVQYEAARVVSGAWKGTSRDKLYNDLGWESLHHRRNFRRLCILYELQKNDFPKYLSENINLCKPKKSLRLINNQSLTNWPCRTSKFRYSFFPSAIKYWNALERETKSANNITHFKNLLLKQIRPKRKEYFGILDKQGTRFITLLRMGLSPLNKHKFDHNFNDTPDSICSAQDGVENTEHFLLLCKYYVNNRATLVRKLTEILKTNFDTYPNKKKVEIILYGSEHLSAQDNRNILMESISFIRKSKRFENAFH